MEIFVINKTKVQSKKKALIIVYFVVIHEYALEGKIVDKQILIGNIASSLWYSAS